MSTGIEGSQQLKIEVRRIKGVATLGCPSDRYPLKLARLGLVMVDNPVYRERGWKSIDNDNRYKYFVTQRSVPSFGIGTDFRLQIGAVPPKAEQKPTTPAEERLRSLHRGTWADLTDLKTLEAKIVPEERFPNTEYSYSVIRLAFQGLFNVPQISENPLWIKSEGTFLHKQPSPAKLHTEKMD